ncbi:MAG: response regulator [Bacillota bacterium]
MIFAQEPDVRLAEILLVEDNPGDIRLIREAFREGKFANRLHVATDGEEALAFLRNRDAPAIDLILLDLNLPKRDGREVLAEIKSDEKLRQIPAVVLTSSELEADILRAYDLKANCYVTKPTAPQDFFEIIRHLKEFWFAVVKLPTR